MCHISNRLKNGLRMAGARYLMIHTGKIINGDLVLGHRLHKKTLKLMPRRWRLADFRMFGMNIARCTMLVKRPLENIK